MKTTLLFYIFLSNIFIKLYFKNSTVKYTFRVLLAFFQDQILLLLK